MRYCKGIEAHEDKANMFCKCSQNVPTGKNPPGALYLQGSGGCHIYSISIVDDSRPDIYQEFSHALSYAKSVQSSHTQVHFFVLTMFHQRRGLALGFRRFFMRKCGASALG